MMLKPEALFDLYRAAAVAAGQVQQCVGVTQGIAMLALGQPGGKYPMVQILVAVASTLSSGSGRLRPAAGLNV